MTKQQILNAVKEEHAILKHLFAKVEAQDLLSYSPGNWYDVVLQKKDSEGQYQQYVDRAEKMDIKQFPDALDKQYTEVETILNQYSDEDLLQLQVDRIAGNRCTLEEAIVNSSLRYLTAYRMQLFLYLKQAGLSQLSTYNCWVGMDKPSKKEG